MDRKCLRSPSFPSSRVSVASLEEDESMRVPETAQDTKCLENVFRHRLTTTGALETRTRGQADMACPQRHRLFITAGAGKQAHNEKHQTSCDVHRHGKCSCKTHRYVHNIHFSSKLSLGLANQNESTVKTLKFGVFIPTLISFLLRFWFRRSSLPPSKGSLAIYIVTFFPAFFLSNYLIKIGTTRRDPITGTLISYGEDLGQPGVTEWCFDILYITCMSFHCQ